MTFEGSMGCHPVGRAPIVLIHHLVNGKSLWHDSSVRPLKPENYGITWHYAQYWSTLNKCSSVCVMSSKKLPDSNFQPGIKLLSTKRTEAQDPIRLLLISFSSQHKSLNHNRVGMSFMAVINDNPTYLFL
uniref:Uncharacterized protein n=1 Tax=Pipistrellus kuhlii TaxID=59472 RepID=A0A7J7VBI1_PIPKU|nr:hypothetical protein mPipKuh1_008473 [Pipistrellus kuhlii]